MNIAAEIALWTRQQGRELATRPDAALSPHHSFALPPTCPPAAAAGSPVVLMGLFSAPEARLRARCASRCLSTPSTVRRSIMSRVMRWWSAAPHVHLWPTANRQRWLRRASAALERVPLEQQGLRRCSSLFGDGHLHAIGDKVSRRSVWWCYAALCCSAIATTEWSCSGGSQSQLLSTSFWRCLHFPVYWGLWPALGLAAQHSIFIRICPFRCSEPEKFSGLQAQVTRG